MNPRKPPAWRRYLRFWGSNIPEDVDDELEFHIEMRTREYVARGLTPEAARAAALARLGQLARARDECLVIGEERERIMRQANVFDSVKTDLKFAARSFSRSPGWTSVALLTIALGIGATTAVFSVVDGLLIHPMSYPNANRVFVVRHDMSVGADAHMYGPIPSDYLTAWRSARSLDGVEGYQRRDITLTLGAEPQIAHAVSIDTSFLSFAGARPLIGRNFSADEATNASRVALLSERYWRRQFGAAHDVLGKVVQADGQSVTIIGVLPASLRLPDFEITPADLWLPRSNSGDQRLRGVLARLRPGVSTTMAETELDSIVARSGLDEPAGSRMLLLRPGETLGFRRTLVMLSGAVALLLLVACANVAHLLLARGAARERELAVRHALGAGRARLVRQLLTESLVLMIGGGCAAIAVGGGGLRVLASLRPTKLSALSQFSLDQRVLFVASVLTISTGIVVGLLVALRTARRGMGEVLRAGNSAGGTGREGRRLGSTLVVSEIALSATLLVGALLLVRGVINLQRADLGFNAHRLYGVTFSLRGGAFASAAPRRELEQLLLERGRRIPGARGVTIAATVPPTGGFLMSRFETPSQSTKPNDVSTVSINWVAPNYFAVLEIPLLGGRTFDARSAERNEVVINERLAKQLWPSDAGAAVGKRFRTAGNDVGPSPWYVVAAVARNAVMHGLLNDGVEPTLYFPLDGGLEANRTTLIVRGSDDAGFAAGVRQFALATRRGAALPTITNVEQELSDSIAEPRFSMRVLAAFAVLAVILAAIGLYGVISYTVARRTPEIGIRMTLGATPPIIARLVVADGLRLSIVGIGLGLVGAIGATRLIQTSLYGVQRSDPWSFAIGAVVLLGISAAACLVPTIRATGVDPAVAVRAE